jgi:hypothetical protein
MKITCLSEHNEQLSLKIPPKMFSQYIRVCLIFLDSLIETTNEKTVFISIRSAFSSILQKKMENMISIRTFERNYDVRV